MDDTSADRSNHIDNHDIDNHDLQDVTAAHFAAGDSSWSGIRTNLAEMEKKLGQLQQQMNPTLRQQVNSTQPRSEVVQVKQQIEDLLRVREMLRESLRGAIGECERMLGQLDRGEPLTSALGAGVGTGPGAGESLLAPATSSRLVPAMAPAGIALRPSVFQGSVSLRVGPLSDISQVDTLEIALLQVPGAEQVEVKEFSGRDAVAEIRLFQPVRLVEELHRVLPFSFEVTQGDAGALTLLANSEPVAVGAVNETPMAAP